MRYSFFALTFLSLFFALPLFSQNTPAQQSNTAVSTAPITSDPQAIQLLTTALNSMVSPALRAITADALIQGTLATPTGGGSGTFVAKARGEDWSLETSRGASNTSYRILRGVGTLVIDGNRKNFPPAVTNGLPLVVFPLFGRWSNFTASGAVAKMRGNMTVGGQNCYQIHLSVPDPNPNPMHTNRHGEIDVLVDSATGTITALAFNAAMDSRLNATVRIEDRFANYRTMAGITLPTQITHCVAGHPHLIYQVTSIVLNNGFSDANFQN